MNNLKLVIISFICLCFSTNYAQDSSTQYEFGVGEYFTKFLQNENSSSLITDRNNFLFSISRKSNLKNGFCFILGINYKNLMLRNYQVESSFLLDFDENLFESVGSIDLEIHESGENWVSTFEASRLYQIDFWDDGYDIQNGEIVNLSSNINFTIHSLGLQLGIEKLLGKGKNKFKIENLCNPFLILNPVFNIDSRGLGLIANFSNEHPNYINDFQLFSRINIQEDTFDITKSNLNRFGLDFSFSAGLMHNESIQILFNIRQTINSLSKIENIKTQSIGLELRYQI